MRWFLLVLVLLAAAGCGSSGKTSTASTPAPAGASRLFGVALPPGTQPITKINDATTDAYLVPAMSVAELRAFYGKAMNPGKDWAGHKWCAEKRNEEGDQLSWRTTGDSDFLVVTVQKDPGGAAVLINDLKNDDPTC